VKRIFFLFLFLVIYLAPHSGRAGAEVVHWRTYAEGITAAKTLDRPVLIMFVGPGCKVCERLDKRVFSRREIAEHMNEKLVPVRVNIAIEEKIAGKYRVFASPIMYFLKPDGTAIDFVPGYVDPETFQGILRYIGDKIYEEKTYQEYLASERNGKEKDNNKVVD